MGYVGYVGYVKANSPSPYVLYVLYVPFWATLCMYGVVKYVEYIMQDHIAGHSFYMIVSTKSSRRFQFPRIYS